MRTWRLLRRAPRRDTRSATPRTGACTESATPRSAAGHRNPHTAPGMRVELRVSIPSAESAGQDACSALTGLNLHPIQVPRVPEHAFACSSTLGSAVSRLQRSGYAVGLTRMLSAVDSLPYLWFCVLRSWSYCSSPEMATCGGHSVGLDFARGMGIELRGFDNLSQAVWLHR